jgi:hypothetical protein
MVHLLLLLLQGWGVRGIWQEMHCIDFLRVP